jgi:hypothetical protein
MCIFAITSIVPHLGKKMYHWSHKQSAQMCKHLASKHLGFSSPAPSTFVVWVPSTSLHSSHYVMNLRAGIKVLQNPPMPG